MYLTFIKKELLQNILSLRYILVFMLFVGLIVSATALRTGMYRQQLRHYYQDANERQDKAGKLVSWGHSMTYGRTVEKAPNPLAIFASGLETEITRSYNNSGWFGTAVGPRKHQAPSFQYNLPVDLCMIITLLCSLLALILIYDSVSGERENGTLKVLLSGPIPRDVIIVSKIAAGFITLMIPLLTAWALSLFHAAFLCRIPFTPDDGLRIALLVLGSILYIGFFFGIGITASCWTQRSATSLAVCLFMWIILTLAIPNMVPLVTARIAPIPPYSKMMQEKDAISSDIWRNMIPRWQEEIGETGKYNSIYEFWNICISPRVNREQAHREEKLYTLFNSFMNRQIGLTQTLSRISPAASFIYASTNVAGTGIQDYRLLVRDFDRYRIAFTDVNSRLEQEMKDKELTATKQWEATHPDGEPFPGVRTAFDPGAWPKFEPTLLPTARAFHNSLFEFCWLAGGTVLLFMIAFVGFLRYDAR